MREDYLHYLWQFQKFDFHELKTIEGNKIQVISPGNHNELSGPDFFNSRLLIGDQEWAGNVEIHLRSSDWYMHGHETDPAYDNVILHVVWDHDVEIYRKDNSPLPVVELQNLVSPGSLATYRNLSIETNLRWINCESDFPDIEEFVLTNWLERLFVERLENKSLIITGLLAKSAGDWEAVFFSMLARNFGLNVNGEAFLSIATSIPFSAVRKIRNNKILLEALFFGQAGLLDKSNDEPYFLKLKEGYLFLKNKFCLSVEGVLPVKYFRLRPDNFPEIRLAQLAAVYHYHRSLFASIQSSEAPHEVYELFNVEPNDFWSTHYTFSRSHSSRKKKLSKKFIDLIIINTVVPLQFSYLKSKGINAFEKISALIKSVSAEENEVIRKYNLLRPLVATSAMESQALIELKKEYCDKKACLNCAVGLKILEKQPQI